MMPVVLEEMVKVAALSLACTAEITGADRALVLVGGAIMLVPSLSPPPHPLSKKPKKNSQGIRR